MSRIACSYRGALLAAGLLAGTTTAGSASAQDLSVVAIDSPTSGCALGSSENVTIRLFNYGATLAAGTTFNVSYVVNALGPTNELVVLGSPLLTNSTFTYTFTTQANLAVPGSYGLSASVALPGDINPANDAYNGWVVTNAAQSAPGALSGSGSPSTSGTMTLNSAVGDVVQWEESDDGGQRWFALANTTTIQDYADLRAPAQFRVRVRNAPCAEVLSNVLTVSP